MLTSRIHIDNDDDAPQVTRTGSAIPSTTNSNENTEPLFYAVASQLHSLMDLPREQHLAIWKRVLGLYDQAGRRIPQLLQDLCQEAFVDSLIENEVFWGLVGTSVSREYYARANDHLSAVYATAALVAAQRDHLPLNDWESAILVGRS